MIDLDACTKDELVELRNAMDAVAACYSDVAKSTKSDKVRAWAEERSGDVREAQKMLQEIGA